MKGPIVGILEHSILLSIANENFQLFRGLRRLESDGDIWCVELKDAPSRHNGSTYDPHATWQTERTS